MDISQLTVGDTLTVGNVRDQFNNFTILQEDDYTLATVTPPAQQIEDVVSSDENATANNIEASG